MKHFLEKGQRFKGILLVFFAFAWWGLLYPELCFTEDTFRQVIVEDGEVKFWMQKVMISLSKADCWNGWRK